MNRQDEEAELFAVDEARATEPTIEQLAELGRLRLEERRLWHAWDETQDKANGVTRDAYGRSPGHVAWRAAQARAERKADELLGVPFYAEVLF